jgi:predicted glycoside hydrolase/deacetylase ChbG (UPF0249 family)
MTSNPVLQKLGFKKTDRLVIIHTDDIGMCQATISAFSDLTDVGLISSGAVMVPCPWFLSAADFCRAHPGVDMGVHLTLTSEWDHYRWGPVSTRAISSGLIDPQGNFFHTTEDAQAHAEVESLELELSSQVERAIAMGIHPTHIDTHMGSVFHPDFLSIYVHLGLANQIPIMFFRKDEIEKQSANLDPKLIQTAIQLVTDLEDLGVPLLDHLEGMSLDSPFERFNQTIQKLDALQAGVTHFIIHPAKDTPELRAITPDWASRVADYETFTDPRMRQYLETSGLQVIGYRHLQQLLNSER